VLATRSSVFKAGFYGPLRARRNKHITIEDIQPDIFRELLHFIYTDSMSPSMSDLDADEKKQLIQHLLVAADRYDVQRLKAVCERALCESLDVETVAAMLALADQQNCRQLKDAAIHFIVCSSDTWDGVAASQGFGNLKRSCLSIMVDILDRAVKSRKI
jgi:speckle-type POZ protein